MGYTARAQMAEQLHRTRQGTAFGQELSKELPVAALEDLCLLRGHRSAEFCGNGACEEIVAARAYRLEEAAVYQDDAVVPDEGLTADPYY